MQNGCILPQVFKLAKRGYNSQCKHQISSAKLHKTLDAVGLRLSEEEIKTPAEMSQ
jgi:hypothetical protein